MLRKVLAGAMLAGSMFAFQPLPAQAVVDCEHQTPCLCGENISIGIPGKPPIFSGNFDC